MKVHLRVEKNYNLGSLWIWCAGHARLRGKNIYEILEMGSLEEFRLCVDNVEDAKSDFLEIDRILERNHSDELVKSTDV